jgi:hypothetical protein
MAVDADFFDRVIHHKSFMSGEPALGWMLFRFPPDLGQLGEHKFRLTVYDPAGKKTTTELSLTDDGTQGAGLNVRPAIQIPQGQVLKVM